MLNILADQNIFQLEKFIPDGHNILLFDPAEGIPDKLSSADALLIRTVTKINENSIGDHINRLRFIGTASSGTDHVDIPYLEKKGIHFASAAGCNARAVAEYIATCLLIWSHTYNEDLTKLTVGIIGVGHVGSEVDKLLGKMNISTILYDPPRQEREPDFISSTMNEVLAADILTFHVPLNLEGKYATFHWLNKVRLEGNYKMIINASRGGVVDEQALMDAFDNGMTEHLILDVWEKEPNFRMGMAERAFIATPHIAGYSHQAKINATRMICDDLIDFYKLKEPAKAKLSDADCRNFQFDDRSIELKNVIQTLNPLLDYDSELRKIMRLEPDEKSPAFRKLRVNKPFRLEYALLGIPDWLCDKYPVLKALDIRCNKTFTA